MANYTTKFRVRTSDLDEKDHLKPYIYFDFFQDIAGFHAESLGFGYDNTIKKNIAWILMKNKVTIYEYPKPYEILTIKTYPTEKSKIDFIRDYEVKDESDRIIARGTSQWCLVDIINKKILRTNVLDFPNDLNEPSFYQEKISKINFNDYDELNKKIEYITRYSDIDHYHHTNNARYAEMIYNAIDLRNIFVKEITLNYNIETPVNKKITIYIKDNIINNKLIAEGGGLNESNNASFTFKIEGEINKEE